MAKTSPTKPHELKRIHEGETGNYGPRISSAVASGAIDLTPENPPPLPHRSQSQLSQKDSLIPPRPSSLSSGPYNSPYGSYSRSGGNYGSSFGSPYGGSSYSSRFGGNYGSSYGSSYGNYGNYDRYGSGNRYGSYGPPGGSYGPPGPPALLDSGYNRLQHLGEYVDGFGRFSRLLDGGMEAVHGSLGSLLRVFEFSAEFMYILKSLAIVRFLERIWRVLNWLIGRNVNNTTPKITTTNQADLTFRDFQKEDGKKRNIAMTLLLLGVSCLSAPMIVTRIWKILREKQLVTNLERVWNEEPVEQSLTMRARHDFRGEDPRMDLTFKQNDLIKVISKPFPEWWEGECNGRRGLFPAQFVETVIEELKK